MSDKVEWIVQDSAKVSYSSVVLTKEGKATVQAYITKISKIKRQFYETTFDTSNTF